ncbi:F-box/FBD/LRR-repeat protein At1g13570-like [Lolium perenne]|uniref:F-box/FBD/LRR-repeat protein At1g13570-like n=1 Tax=Lolium perenne TaxID=4522 RepID=UPI0021F67259|nr:F-box/FBD/LRR-repeat protein At1g13570-like [Lolium perenne]
MDHECASTKVSKYVAEEDIISNLPDGLKDKILCCLPIKEAVGTCLLSRNWRYTWTSMTELMFRGDDFASDNGYDECRFLKFTDMFLSLHNGPVLKFGLDTQGIEISTGGHIHRWMLMLSRNRIKEIQLMTSMHEDYNIPSCFFSCAELQYVQLRLCVWTTSQLPMLYKGFKHLHTLHLEFFTVEGNNFGDLVASCPNLEKLTFFWLISFANINIHSTKLKILTVHGQFNHLSLHTPYLTSAVIELKQVAGDALNARCNFNVSQFIASLSDVKNISLHGSIFELAEHEFLVYKPPKSFNQLTEISLNLDLGNLKQANLALCLFQHAPNLQLIILELTSKNPMVPTVHLWESIDGCLFQNVRLVGMNNFTASSAELAFLKRILEDAPVLRKAEIRDKGKLGKDDLKSLLKMRRASKDAEIVIF